MPKIDSCNKTATMEKIRNKVVDTKSHVTIMPPIENPTTGRMLSRYDRNLSKLNFRFVIFFSLPITFIAETREENAIVLLSVVHEED